MDDTKNFFNQTNSKKNTENIKSLSVFKNIANCVLDKGILSKYIPNNYLSVKPLLLVNNDIKKQTKYNSLQKINSETKIRKSILDQETFSKLNNSPQINDKDISRRLYKSPITKNHDISRREYCTPFTYNKETNSIRDCNSKSTGRMAANILVPCFKSDSNFDIKIQISFYLRRTIFSVFIL